MRFEARFKLIGCTMLPKKRTTPYNNSHCIQYSVRLAHRSTGGTVNVFVSIECMFCIYFGCEIKVGFKRECTSTTKFFESPFCLDVYKQHHYIQYPERWRE